MSMDRLSRGDWIAWLAALALLVVMSVDWWGTTLGDDFRHTESIAPTSGAESGEIGRQVGESAAAAAESEERNAWQPAKFIDGVILVTLLLAAAWTLVAVGARAAGKRYDMSLNAVAGVAAGVGGVLVGYRILQEPGLDAITTVKVGAPAAVLCCAALALAHSSALSDERAEQSPEQEPEPEAAPAPVEATPS
jgi:nucleotide-binding universal stress UspA family protein